MYSNGAGFYLQVTTAGAKSWIYRYQRDGKERQYLSTAGLLHPSNASENQ